MRSLQRRIVALTDAAANLIALLRELERLTRPGPESTIIGPEIARKGPPQSASFLVQSKSGGTSASRFSQARQINRASISGSRKLPAFRTNVSGHCPDARRAALTT